MKWFKNSLSIDETRTSALIVGFLVSLGFALYQVVVLGDISNNFLELMSWLIAGVTGLSSVHAIASKMNKTTSTTPARTTEDTTTTQETQSTEGKLP